MDNIRHKKIVNEGLNLQKRKGRLQFDNITVDYEILPHNEETRKRGIEYPVSLDYMIDGEPFPDSLTDPKFNIMVKNIEPTFSEKIKPYFENRGYYLWSY